MTTTFDAIYENGKLVLPTSLPLPERAHVRVTIETDPVENDIDRAAWLKVSQDALTKTWGNQEDDVFNELLKK